MQDRVVRYGWAVVLVAATCLLRMVLNPLIGTRTPFVVLFFLPVIAAAWRGGAGPAMLAAVLGVAVGDTVSMDFQNGVPLMARVVRVTSFLLESWFVAWVLRERSRESSARRESERRYRHLAENYPGGAVLMVDRELRYVVADGLGLAEVGLSGAAMIGRTPYEIYPSDQAEQIAGSYRAALRGEARLEEMEFRGHSYLVRSVPMRNEVGEVVAAITVTQDVTERRQLEAQLRETQKLEAVGRLAGGVAHDFNNLLSIITGSCELIFLQSGKSLAVTAHAQAIEEAALRAATLTRQLLAFSRHQVLETERLQLSELVTSLAPSLQRLLGERVLLQLELGDELGNLNINRTQAERAISNLCVNARDAMPEGGTVLMRTRAAQIIHDSEVPAGDYVVLSVRDTGVGMDAHTRAHLFEPYFTTKGDKGTGLGLSIVHGFVGRSQGHLRVRSEAGQGTEIELYLPLADDQLDARLRSSRRISTPSAGRKVLVVDDEDSIRNLICQLLESMGYSVQGASNGESALAQVSAEFSLVVADLELPDMAGRELCRGLRRRFPEVPLLLISGADLTIPSDELQGLRWAFLAKPFGMSALAEQVELLSTPLPVAEQQLMPVG